MGTKFWNRILALAAAAVAVGLASDEALATVTTGHASAAIVQAINLTETTQMNFGFIIPGASPGTLVLPTSGPPTPNGVTYLNGAVAGAWQVQGTANQPMSVTLDTSGTLTSGGNTMTIDTFNHDITTLNFQSGTVNFHVGATLHVGGNQAPGTYIGTYTVQVDY